MNQIQSKRFPVSGNEQVIRDMGYQIHPLEIGSHYLLLKDAMAVRISEIFDPVDIGHVFASLGLYLRSRFKDLGQPDEGIFLSKGYGAVDYVSYLEHQDGSIIEATFYKNGSVARQRIKRPVTQSRAC